MVVYSSREMGQPIVLLDKLVLCVTLNVNQKKRQSSCQRHSTVTLIINVIVFSSILKKKNIYLFHKMIHIKSYIFVKLNYNLSKKNVSILHLRPLPSLNICVRIFKEILKLEPKSNHLYLSWIFLLLSYKDQDKSYLEEG